MSPEILFGALYGARADIWSLAAVAFEYSNYGQPLFDDSNDLVEHLIQQQNEPNMNYIYNSKVGCFSNLFIQFFKQMLSLEEIQRPHATTVLNKSFQNQSELPYLIVCEDHETYVQIN